MPADPFVEPSALGALAPIRYLDCRDQAAFEAGHPLNAVRVASDSWDTAAKASNIGFGDVGHWEDVISNLGIDGSTVAAVYDAGGMTNAARVWFMLQLFGAQAVIINGGWPVMAASGSLPAGVPPASGRFKARSGSGTVGVIERTELRDQLNTQAHVFDTRAPKEYSGEQKGTNPRAGHLPGARNLSHTELMTDGVVHSADRLRGMLESVGFQQSDRIVTHCQGGGRAALGAAAALRAGFGDVRVYYHSFGDWARDDTCPVVRD